MKRWQWIAPVVVALVVLLGRPHRVGDGFGMTSDQRAFTIPEPTLPFFDLVPLVTQWFVTPPPPALPSIEVSATPVPALLVASRPHNPVLPAAITFRRTQIPVQSAERVVTTTENGWHWQWNVPLGAAGHHNDTKAFGQQGATVLVGHREWYEANGVFAGLLTVDTGDLLYASNSDGSVFVYRALAWRDYDYDNGEWLIFLQEVRDPLLVLYTCNDDFSELRALYAEFVCREGTPACQSYFSDTTDSPSSLGY